MIEHNLGLSRSTIAGSDQPEELLRNVKQLSSEYQKIMAENPAEAQDAYRAWLIAFHKAAIMGANEPVSYPRFHRASMGKTHAMWSHGLRMRRPNVQLRLESDDSLSGLL